MKKFKLVAVKAVILALCLGFLSMASTGCKDMFGTSKVSQADKKAIAKETAKMLAEQLKDESTASKAASATKPAPATNTEELPTPALPKTIKDCKELPKEFIAICQNVDNLFKGQYDDAVRVKAKLPDGTVLTKEAAEMLKAEIPQNILDVYLANLTAEEVKAKKLPNEPYRCITDKKVGPAACFSARVSNNLGANVLANLGTPKNYGYVNAMDAISQVHTDLKSVKATGEDTNGRVKDIQGKVNSIKATGEDTNGRVKGIQNTTNRSNEILESMFGKRVPPKKGVTNASATGSGIPDAGKKPGSGTIPDRPGRGKKPGSGSGVSDYQALWDTIQAGWEEMDKGKVCGAVSKLIAGKASYQPKFSKRNWANIEGLSSGYCKKQKIWNTVAKSTVRGITQGTCLNTVADKMFGKKDTECNFNLPQAISGYGMTNLGTRAAAAVTNGRVRKEIAQFGDKKLGDDYFSKWTKSAAGAYITAPLGDGPVDNPFGPGSGQDGGGQDGTIAGTTGDQYWTNGQHGITQGSQTTWQMPPMDKNPAYQPGVIRAAGTTVSAADSTSALDAFGGIGSKKAGGLK